MSDTNAPEDLAEDVRQMLDNAVVVMVGEQAEAKSARATVPKPFVGYLTGNTDFSPPARTKQSWIYALPPLFYWPGDAQAERAAYQAMAPNHPPKTIFKVTVTFEIVEGAGRD